MLGRAILPLIREPVVRLRWDSLPLVPRHQLVQIRDPHATSDHLADTRNENIDGLRKVRSFRQTLHVERLEDLREMDEHDDLSDLIRHLPFRSLGDVVPGDVRRAVLFGDVVLVEIFDGVAVVETHEGSFGGHEFGVEGTDDFSGNGVLKEGIDDFADLPQVRITSELS